MSSSPARIVLGTGVEAFEPIDGEPTISLIKGFQGGFHVWTSFLAYGFDTTVLRMQLQTSWDDVPDSIVEMQGNMRIRDVVDDAGLPAGASVGWPAVVYDPTCANGRRIRIDITVHDPASGAQASDTRRFIADVAEVDRAVDCLP